MPNNLLGIYNDPTYGVSTYSILSQIQPESFNPVFNQNATLDSVVFNLPYFSTLTEININDDGETENTYELDSIYGSEAIKLSIYRSNYFLRDLDPTAGDNSNSEQQLYYSDDIANFGLPNLTETGEEFITSIDSFTPSAEELILVSPDEDEDEEDEITRMTPRLRISLISEDAALAIGGDRIANQEVINRFTSWFIDKEGSQELSNQNNFRNYFRGIYLKAEPVIADSGNLFLFDITSGNITLYYSYETEDTEDTDGDQDTTEYVTATEDFVFSFSNSIVNSIENDFKTSIVEAYQNQDELDGESNLYIKGGEGSYAVIDLFSRYVETDDTGNFIVDDNGGPIFIETPEEPSDNDKTELDFLKNQEWLINNASIKFYVNHEALLSGGDVEPDRIYIFDLETGNILIDYSDESQNTLDPLNSLTNHLGKITRDSDDKGEFYQIRLTRHIIDILNQDADNVKLGVAVSQNVNTTAIANGCNINDMDCIVDELIPYSSILSHEGTILYGNSADVPEDVRLKLEIFYTELKDN